MNKLFFTQRGNRWLAGIFWGAGALLAVLSVSGLMKYVLRLMPPCIIRSVTGIPCPGCGITRATVSLLHLHPIEAFRYNPGFTVFLMVAFVWLIWFTVNTFRKNYKTPFQSKGYMMVGIALAVFMLVFGMLRLTVWIPDWFYR